MTQQINLEGLKVLAEKMQGIEITVSEPLLQEYVYHVWDEIGDSFRVMLAESEAEAEFDLRHELRECAYMYEGEPHFKLFDIH